jgi:hypothetical protein
MLRRYRILYVQNLQFLSNKKSQYPNFRFLGQCCLRERLGSYMLRRKFVLAGHNSQFQSSRKPPLSNRSDNRFDNLSGRQYPSHRRSLRPSVPISSDSRYQRGGPAPSSIPIQLLLKHSIVSDRCLKASV